MKELIQSLIRNELLAYGDKISELTSEVNELKRRISNMIRVGVCSEIGADFKTIKVKHSGNETPFIQWLACSAGDVIDYRCPSVGEQCLLLNYAGGNNSSQSFALFGLFNERFPSPGDDPQQILRVFADGSRIEYHLGSHEMNITTMGDVNLTAKGVVNVDGDKIHLNQGCGVVTGEHICMVTGKPHGDFSSQVTAGK